MDICEACDAYIEAVKKRLADIDAKTREVEFSNAVAAMASVPVSTRSNDVEGGAYKFPGQERASPRFEDAPADPLESVEVAASNEGMLVTNAEKVTTSADPNIQWWREFVRRVHSKSTPSERAEHTQRRAQIQIEAYDGCSMGNVSIGSLMACDLESLRLYLSPSLPVANADPNPTVYVNARQYKCILGRRHLRETGKVSTLTSRKPYLHESRHRHACKRKRGPGGRFLTREEMQKLKLQEEDSLQT